MAAVVVGAIAVVTAMMFLLSWRLDYGMGASLWIAVGISVAMGLWYWFRNRQLRREDLKARGHERP